MHRKQSQFEAVRNTDLLENAGEVMLDCLLADREPFCDFLVRIAIYDRADDLEFAPGQTESVGVVRTWLVSILVAVTMTPPSAVPEGPVTLPFSAPVPDVCATKAEEQKFQNKTTNRNNNLAILSFPYPAETKGHFVGGHHY